MLPPSDNQVRYLRHLGYKGVKPSTSGQASAAITVLEKGGDSKAAEKAVLKQQKAEQREEEEEKEDRWYKKQRLTAVPLLTRTYPTCIHPHFLVPVRPVSRNRPVA